MLVGQTKRLTAYFSMYIKFENVIGLEILSGKLLLHMTYHKYYYPKTILIKAFLISNVRLDIKRSIQSSFDIMNCNVTVGFF